MSEGSPSSDGGFSGRAVSGAAWQGAVNISIRLLRAAVFIVLARIPAPDAFGLIALAMVFVLTLQYVSGAGLSSALVHVQVLTKSHLDTAFWAGTGAGVVLSVVLASSAGAVSVWFHQPGLDVVLLGLSVMPLLSGLTMVPEGLLSREFQFRALSLRHIAAAATSVGLAVGLALAGYGVWALVAQTVGEALASCIALWFAMRRRYRIGTRVTRTAFREIVPFSGKVLGQNMTQLVSTRGDDFLVGAVLARWR